MRQAFAIPIVDEISNSGQEKENDNNNEDNNNKKENNNEIDNNLGEDIIEDNAEIKSIGVEDLDSLFPI